MGTIVRNINLEEAINNFAEIVRAEFPLLEKEEQVYYSYLSNSTVSIYTEKDKTQMRLRFTYDA